MPIPTVGPVADVVFDQVALDEWGNAIGASSVGRVLHRFASTAERDAAIPNPTQGMMAVTTDTDTVWQVVGSTRTWRRAGPRLWSSASAIQATATMNGNQDIPYSDLGGVFPVVTVAVAVVNSIYISPDRGTPLSALIYSNSFTAPQGGGRQYAATPVVTAAAAGWYFVGDLVARQVIPAGTGGPVWQVRCSGPVGGPTTYSYAYQLTLERFVA